MVKASKRMFFSESKLNYQLKIGNKGDMLEIN